MRIKILTEVKLRIGTGGRHWYMQYRTFRFLEMQGISRLAEN